MTVITRADRLHARALEVIDGEAKAVAVGSAGHIVGPGAAATGETADLRQNQPSA
ncbi:hypothetical protein [Actinomadura opuntiae]|uniref:hypothetical protein n=1 Tax=Actinomadura sp. OS1-43 TaxID=604315 RepID=UPI00255B3A38|nr:hypothetical protein [Actinomadura sp. OS1-43]MDL4814064.1 hypothetical protein [Actinomadura sp. OS1-43]